MKKIFITIMGIMALISMVSPCCSETMDVQDNYRILNANNFLTSNIDEFNKVYFDKFDEYSYEADDNSIKFTSFDDSNANLIYGYELFDTENETLTKIINAEYDLENNIYNVSMEVKDSTGHIVDSYYGVFEPIFATNDSGFTEIYFEMDDKLIPLSIVYSQEPIQDLFDDILNFTGDISVSGGGAIILFAVTIVPFVVDITVDVIEGIGTVVTTIFDWFTTVSQSIFGSSTSNVISSSYTLNLENVKYDFIVLTQSKINTMNKGNIYVAIADTYTGLMWISTVNINETLAASILFTESTITSLAGSKTLVISTYTYYSSEAYKLAQAAGGGSLPKSAEVHGGGSAGYYWHYHPYIGGLVGASHSFYGNPTT
jgi:hypothetical protein